MPMHVVDQDRENIYPYSPDIYTAMVNSTDGHPWGVNLFMNEHFLGTFNDMEDVANEITVLINSKDDIVVVSGYSNYDGEDDILALVNE